MPNAVTLVSVAHRYTLERDLTEKSGHLLLWSCSRFVRFMGHDPHPEAIETDQLNLWILAMQSAGGLTARTIANNRSNVLTVLDFAADIGLRESHIERKRIRRVKKTKPLPQAWTADEFDRVRHAAAWFPGRLPNWVSRRLYFSTLIRVAYETGLRRGDIWRLDMPTTTVIRIRQSKTGDPHTVDISKETLSLFRFLIPPKPLHWPLSEATYYNCWRAICQTAGVDPGAGHQIRRTGATLVFDARKDTRDVVRYLGHRSPEMWRHYVDLSKSDESRPTPPPIGMFL